MAARAAAARAGRSTTQRPEQSSLTIARLPAIVSAAQVVATAAMARGSVPTGPTGRLAPVSVVAFTTTVEISRFCSAHSTAMAPAARMAETAKPAQAKPTARAALQEAQPAAERFSIAPEHWRRQIALSSRILSPAATAAMAAMAALSDSAANVAEAARADQAMAAAFSI